MPNVVALRVENLMGRDEYEADFMARTRALREAANLTQRQIAELLGCSDEAYRKYEGRTPMPTYLMAKFTLIVGTNLDYLISGQRRVRHKVANNVTVLPNKARG